MKPSTRAKKTPRRDSSESKTYPSGLKRFGIELRWPRSKNWYMWQWYATEAQRDAALKRLVKNEERMRRKVATFGTKLFRKIDK